MHIIINKYLTNNKIHLSFEENYECDQIALEIQFKSISNNLVNDVNKTLENYQINVIKYLDGNYVRNFFKPQTIELSVMCHRIICGENTNEVNVIKESLKKKGFLKNFFNY